MEYRSFTNVMKLLRCLEVREGQEDFDSTLDIMFKTLKERNPEHIAVRQYAVFKQAAGKTAQSIMVSCSVRLTIFNFAAQSNMNSKQLNRIMFENYDMSVAEFFKKERIEKAKDLLIHTELSMSQIVHRVGFSNEFSTGKYLNDLRK